MSARIHLSAKNRCHGVASLLSRLPAQYDGVHLILPRRHFHKTADIENDRHLLACLMEGFRHLGNQFLLAVRKKIAVIVVPVLSLTEHTADRNHGVIGIGGSLDNEIVRDDFYRSFPVNEPLVVPVDSPAPHCFRLHIILVESIQFRIKTETDIGQTAHEIHHIRPVHIAGTCTAGDEVV